MLDPRFEQLVLGNAAIERIATGFRFTEGPVWFGDGRYLLFSDIPNDRHPALGRGDRRGQRCSASPSHYANGNTRDRQGRLITCEHDTQRLTRTEYDGTVTVLADQFEGKRLTGPNDVVVKSDGSIWFSDNGAGTRGNYLGHTAPQELPFRVYRIDPATGAMTIAVGDMERPNGLASRRTKRGFMSSTRRAAAEDARMSMTWSRTAADGERPGVLRRHAGLRRRHPLRHRRQCLVRLLRRRGRGRRRRLRARRHADRPHPAAGALRQPVLRRQKRNRLFMAASQSVYSLYVEAQGALGG